MEIDEKEYNELRRNQEKLFCLISHGVEDSWDEYTEAMKDYEQWLKKDKQKQKINKIVDTYKDKVIKVFQPILNELDTRLSEDGIKELKNILQELCIKTFDVVDKNNEKWANDLMDVIEEIAQEKYPDIPYWLDTGNRYQCCMEMLDHFRKDL